MAEFIQHTTDFSDLTYILDLALGTLIYYNYLLYLK